MKNLKLNYLMITIVMCASMMLSCKAQVTDNEDYQNLILGEWVAEGSSISDKWVFLNDNTLQEFTNNQVDETYSWEIIESTNSGVKSVYLELTNTTNPNDFYNYEISALTDEELVLIYQREENMGLGKPFTLVKQ